MALPTLYGAMSGSAVSLLQDVLEQKVPGWNLAAEAGVFGSATTRAVEDFQRRNGLVVDGIVGPRTWTALGFDPNGFLGEEVVVEGKSPVEKSAPALLAVAVLGGLWLWSRDRR